MEMKKNMDSMLDAQFAADGVEGTAGGDDGIEKKEEEVKGEETEQNEEGEDE